MENPDQAWEQWRRITSGEETDPLEVLRLVAMFQRYFDAELQDRFPAAAAGQNR